MSQKRGTQSQDDWDRPVEGALCPLCPPRPQENKYWIEVQPMSSSTLCLFRDQTYLGTCLLIYDTTHAESIHELSEEEYVRLCKDLRRATKAVVHAFKPDHVNTAILGNVVHHLHIHIIPRYRSDPRWGRPIWTTHRREMVTTELEEVEYRSLCDHLRRHLQED